MNYKRIGLVLALIFIFFNSIYLVRFSIPGLANSSVDLAQDPQEIGIPLSFSDIEVFDDNYYIVHINNTLYYDVYYLMGYTSDMQQIFSTPIHSTYEPEIDYVDEDGLFVQEYNILQANSWRSIVHYSLQGDLKDIKNGISFDDIPFGSGVLIADVVVTKSDNLVYISSWAATDRDQYLNYFLFKTKVWDLETGEIELLKDWVSSDLYDVNLVEDNGQLYAVELIYEEGTQGLLLSYEINGKSLGEPSSSQSVYLPPEPDAVISVGPEEVYAFSLEISSGLTFTSIELVSRQSHVFQQEGNIVLANGIQLQAIDDLLIITLGLSVEFENTMIFYTLDLQGSNLVEESMDIPEFQNGQHLLVNHIIEDNENVYFVARNTSSESDILKFESAYSTPFLSQSISDGLQINLLVLLLSLAYVGVEYRRSLKLEDSDDLQYPSQTEVIDDDI